LFHGLLQNRFVQVMSALLSGFPICVVARCGKYPLPTSLFAGIGVFALQGVRQCDSAKAAFEIAPVLLSNYFEMSGEWFFHGCRKHRVPIFVTFAGTHNYLIGDEIDIFDSQLQTLHQSQARSVEKHHH
jgi:hypothetical protein